MTLLGEKGLTNMARLSHEMACDLADRLGSIEGVDVETEAFFNEFTIRLPQPAVDVVDKLAASGVLAGVPASRLFPGQFEDLLIVAATETNTEEDLIIFEKALRGVLS